MINASGTKTTRLTGTKPSTVADPIWRISGGTPDEVLTVSSCQAFDAPKTTRPMPRVMISGCTRKTPLPMPLMTPMITAMTSGTMIATASPCCSRSEAATKADMDAVAATDRSMPPVSITIV